MAAQGGPGLTATSMRLLSLPSGARASSESAQSSWAVWADAPERTGTLRSVQLWVLVTASVRLGGSSPVSPEDPAQSEALFDAASGPKALVRGALAAVSDVSRGVGRSQPSCRWPLSG